MIRPGQTDDQVVRESEPIEDSATHLEAGKGFRAGPVEGPGEVRAFAHLDHHFRRIIRPAGLPDLVPKELRRLAGGPEPEQSFVHTAGPGQGIAVEQGQAEGDRVFRCARLHPLLGFRFLMAIEIRW